jgi:hypothetical protein
MCQHLEESLGRNIPWQAKISLAKSQNIMSCFQKLEAQDFLLESLGVICCCQLSFVRRSLVQSLKTSVPESKCFF